ncbi:SnoaL-domain-containing protein [Xylariaceae sp. FL0255]|nr:SnoaL-domain-containing protein [Xylariaceae sp. FL0255]
MADIQETYKSYIRCVNEQRWADILNYVTEPVNLNGQDYSAPGEIEKRIKAAGRINLTIDAITFDGTTPCLGAYVITKLHPGAKTDADAADTPAENDTEPEVITFVEQHFIWTNKDGKIFKVGSMPDSHSLTQQLSDPKYRPLPDLISSNSSEPEPGQKQLSAAELEETYRAYVACINARTIEADLPRFCHDVVTHNAKPLPLQQYGRLVLDAIEAIPDLDFGIDVLLCDEGAQRVAVRIDLAGTPKSVLAGIEPTGKSSEYLPT